MISDHVLIGTSGFSYRDWLGNFYPQFCPAADFLRYYGSRFKTVEIDATFYRIPTVDTVKKWVKNTPDDFVFAAKFPQSVTHEGDLNSRLDNARAFIEVMKNKVLKFMNDHNLEDYISVIAKFVPNAKALKKGSHITNYKDSMAYGSDFAGTNPFGGICINKEHVEDYEEFRDKLIHELGEIEHEGKKIFTWIKKREDLYNGELIDRYPDILYEMLPKYGSGFSLHSDLITINPTHKKISGGHKKNGVFFINRNNDWVIDKKECKITNMFETLLSLYGLTGNSETTKSFLIHKQF